MLPPTCGLGLSLGEEVSLPGALMALGTERRETGDLLSLTGKEAMDALREVLALVFPLLTFSIFRFFNEEDLDREVEPAHGIKWRQPNQMVSVGIASVTVHGDHKISQRGQLYTAEPLLKDTLSAVNCTQQNLY